jgi:hypothetical protein
MSEQGWPHDKRVRVEAAFYQFLNRCFVNSKDYGRICLGERLYFGQRYAITQIFDALEQDIHDIAILKARQLGVSTLFRALGVFFLGIFHGLKGAIVFDTDNNKMQARLELETIIKDLPRSLKFPKIKSNNRAGLTLESDSQILFMSAGVKKSKSSGTLGRSVGLSVAMCSEMCSWDNDEGQRAFRESLSDLNPDRLYVWESTARGFNAWYTLWQEARTDVAHWKCIFIGWWGKESQKIDRDHPDFDVYGTSPPTDKEAEKIRRVKQLYGIDISVEQLAWYRRKVDPTARSEGDADAEFEGDSIQVQEQPWTEDEAFQQTGSIFFSAEKLTEVTNRDVSLKFNSFFYSVGQEFVDTHVIKAPTAKMAELKVWEEPDPDGYYIIGCDPAFGENELNDRSSIFVGRAYADGLDQVAEYACPMPRTEQLAWVLASLMGWYGSGANSQVKYAMELNGPGTAVFTELRSLKHQIESHSYLDSQLQERGLKDIFRNVKTYIYSRVDAIQGGFNLHIKTTAALKITFMERLRDALSNGKLRVRSLDLVSEMKTIAREGDTIKAPGSMKDDRVLAAAFAVHCWETGPRRTLMVANRTRESEAARQRLTITDQVNLFQSNQLQYFFASKRRARVDLQREQTRRSWRSR